MKFSCLKSNLNPIVQLASKIISTRPTLPVLNNVLLKTDRGGVLVSSTNLELSMSAFVGAKVETEGGITVPAKLLAEFINSIPDEKISLEFKDSRLEVTGANYSAAFNTIDMDEFPEPPAMKGEDKVLIPVPVLRANILQVALAAAADESRPVITGVLMVIDGKKFTLAAADGYRLAEQKVTLSEDSGKSNLRLIVPARGLHELHRLLFDAGEKDFVEVSFDENQALFKYKDIQLTSRLLAGQFPDYQQIIPKKFASTVTVERAEFSQAVKTAAIFAKDSASVIFLSADPAKKTLELKASTSQVGENNISVAAEITGPGGSIAFNARYVSDMLAVTTSAKVSLNINDALSPGVLIPDTGAGSLYTYVIMPIRT